MAVAEILRARFGTAIQRERVLLDLSGHSIDLLIFGDQPCRGASTMVTAGLSQLPWHRLDEELMMSVWKNTLTADLRQVLEFVARQLAEGREPLTRGDVIGPAGPLVPGTSMEALYVCQPTYFPDEAATFDLPDRVVGRLWWLIPIHASEARLVDREGAEFFEDLLVAEDPDLLSLDRPPISLK